MYQVLSLTRMLNILNKLSMGVTLNLRKKYITRYVYYIIHTSIIYYNGQFSKIVLIYLDKIVYKTTSCLELKHLSSVILLVLSKKIKCHRNIT